VGIIEEIEAGRLRQIVKIEDVGGRGVRLFEPAGIVIQDKGQRSLRKEFFEKFAYPIHRTAVIERKYTRVY
jgi:hypothetical protein